MHSVNDALPTLLGADPDLFRLGAGGLPAVGSSGRRTQIARFTLCQPMAFGEVT